MISRVGGEGADATYDKSNYLALDDNEKICFPIWHR